MEVIIKPAKPEDAPAIARVNIASWQSTYRGLIAMRFDEYLKKWNNIISRGEENFCFVAENESGEVIGYACGGENTHAKFSFRGELFAIYLLREYQGQRIGKKLFMRSIEEFKKRNIPSFLLFVLSSNTHSRKFYESFKPDFTADEMITIDNGQYCDLCYGWSSLSILSP